MDKIFIRTRKLTMNQLLEVSKWLDTHATGPVSIRGAKHRVYIQQYVAEHDGNKRIHELKVDFFNETDARHFLMEWG